MPFHKLLNRQIKKYLGENLQGHPDLKAFIEAVNDSYQSFERDKEITDHAFRLSEQEYIEVYTNLNKEYNLRKLSIEKLKEGLSKIKGTKLSPLDESRESLLPIVDYINDEITKRKDVEENLSRTLQLLTTLLSNLQSGILVENEFRQIMFTNSRFCHFFSIPLQPEDLVGADCSQSAEQSKSLFKEPEKFVKLIEDLLEKKEKTVGIEMEMQNGTVLSLDYIPIYIDNIYKGHLWDYSDITERKKAEANLLNVTNLQQAILNGTNYSIVYVDTQGIIKSFNQGAEEMLGYKASEVIDKYTPALFHTQEEIDARARQLTQELNRTISPGFEVFIAKSINNVVDTNEWTYVTKSGKHITVLLSVSIIRNEHGKPIGSLGIARDISEQKLAERSLKQTEEKYKNIVEKSTDIIYKTDMHGNFTFVNPVAVRITEFSDAELTRMNYLELIREDFREMTQHFYVNQIRRKTPSTYFEFPIITKKGNQVWIGQSVQLSQNHNNEIELVALAIDISKQKKIEKEITETNQRLTLFHSLINNTSDSIQVCKENGQLFYINNEAANRLGISSDKVSEYNVSDFEVLFKEKGTWQKHVAELKQKSAIIIEGENINQKTGKIFPVEVTVRYIYIQDTGYIIANSRDITLRKQTENLIRAQEEKYRNIIANMRLGLLEVDADEKIQYSNQSFNNMSGYSTDEMVGKSVSKLFGGNNNQHLSTNTRNGNINAHSEMYEMRVNNKKGEVKWWMISGAPNYNSEGKFIGSIKIHLDITEQKKLEFELEQSKIKAEVASKAKEAFLANMSHEIRTPLNAITGMIRQLKRETLNEKQQQYVDNSYTASKHLLSIINNILDISKIEAGELSIVNEHFRLKESLDKVVGMLQPKAIEKNLLLKYHISKEIKEVLIGDSLRIEQILVNLISNAIKFTPGGNVTITCNLLKSTHALQKIEIAVSDTGVGMDEAYLQKIFSKFSQEDKSTSRKYGGTGLGTAITYELVQLMAGSIEVKSTKGVGSTFYVKLWLEIGSAEKISKPLNAESLSDVIGTKVLLVEDNEMNRLVAQNTLGYYGCKVTEATNGYEAIKVLEKENFDIILMDIQMPEMNGIEATTVIRKQLGLNTPIIALTANAFKSEMDLCKATGMNDYITKPFEEAVLINTISKYKDLKIKASLLATLHPGIPTSGKLYNLSSLISTSHGNKDFVTKMITLFITQASSTSQQITNAIKEQNYQEVSRLSHKIKPSIDNMGIHVLKEVIRQLENDAAKNPEPEHLEKIAKTVTDTLSETIRQLRIYLSEN